jgi:hypothetical protein
MSDEAPDPFEQIWAAHAARVQAQKELSASPEYQNEVKFISRVTGDLVRLLQVCNVYSTRAGEYSANSIVARSTEDLAQSVLAAWNLIQDGLINPVKRELRYLIESQIKYLFVDQQTESGKPLAKLDERLDYLQANVDSSIDVREQLKLHLFHLDDAKQFVDELYDAYRECCAYVHVSRRQIEERLKLAEAGRSLGFETADELRKIGRLMFRIYDMALALYFHGYGASMTGDVFVTVLDDWPEWKFHKGKYVKIVSAYYDYKHERNMRKYGESRPHDPAAWPPKRL